MTNFMSSEDIKENNLDITLPSSVKAKEVHCTDINPTLPSLYPESTFESKELKG